jgi:uncharacterized membrane protein YhiD involved in acid resistance
MNNLDQLASETVSVIDFGAFVMTLISATVLGFVLSWHYNKFFPYVSKSQGMGRTLVAIAIVTTIVISVVKSSLALSLGLVGALSIVRFRTPIKEPYELTYIFSSIAIGLGLGANQLAITFVGIFVLLIAMTIMSKGKSNVNDNVFFIYLTVKDGHTSEQIIKEVKKVSSDLNKTIDIRRLDINVNETLLTLNLSLQDINDLEKITVLIKNSFPDSDISIVDGQRLMPM